MALSDTILLRLEAQAGNIVETLNRVGENLTRIGTSADDTQRQLGRLDSAVQAVNRGAFSALEARIVSINQTLELFGRAVTGIKWAADQVSHVAGYLERAAASSIRVGNEFDRAAKSAKMFTEDFISLQSALTDATSAGFDAGESLNRFSGFVSAAKAGVVTYADAMRALGVDLTKLNDPLNRSGQALEQILQSFDRTKMLSSEYTSALRKAFGLPNEQAAQLLDLLQRNAVAHGRVAKSASKDWGDFGAALKELEPTAGVVEKSLTAVTTALNLIPVVGPRAQKALLMLRGALSDFDEQLVSVHPQILELSRRMSDATEKINHYNKVIEFTKDTIKGSLLLPFQEFEAEGRRLVALQVEELAPAFLLLSKVIGVAGVAGAVGTMLFVLPKAVQWIVRLSQATGSLSGKLGIMVAGLNAALGLLSAMGTGSPGAILAAIASGGIQVGTMAATSWGMSKAGQYLTSPQGAEKLGGGVKRALAPLLGDTAAAAAGAWAGGAAAKTGRVARRLGTLKKNAATAGNAILDVANKHPRIKLLTTAIAAAAASWVLFKSNASEAMELTGQNAEKLAHTLEKMGPETVISKLEPLLEDLKEEYAKKNLPLPSEVQSYFDKYGPGGPKGQLTPEEQEEERRKNLARKNRTGFGVLFPQFAEGADFEANMFDALLRLLTPGEQKSLNQLQVEQAQALVNAGAKGTAGLSYNEMLKSSDGMYTVEQIEQMEPTRALRAVGEAIQQINLEIEEELAHEARRIGKEQASLLKQGLVEKKLQPYLVAREVAVERRKGGEDSTATPAMRFQAEERVSVEMATNRRAQELRKWELAMLRQDRAAMADIEMGFNRQLQSISRERIQIASDAAMGRINRETAAKLEAEAKIEEAVAKLEQLRQQQRELRREGKKEELRDTKPAEQAAMAAIGIAKDQGEQAQGDVKQQEELRRQQLKHQTELAKAQADADTKRAQASEAAATGATKQTAALAVQHQQNLRIADQELDQLRKKQDLLEEHKVAKDSEQWESLQAEIGSKEASRNAMAQQQEAAMATALYNERRDMARQDLDAAAKEQHDKLSQKEKALQHEIAMDRQLESQSLEQQKQYAQQHIDIDLDRLRRQLELVGQEPTERKRINLEIADLERSRLLLTADYERQLTQVLKQEAERRRELGYQSRSTELQAYGSPAEQQIESIRQQWERMDIEMQRMKAPEDLRERMKRAFAEMAHEAQAGAVNVTGHFTSMWASLAEIGLGGQGRASDVWKNFVSSMRRSWAEGIADTITQKLRFEAYLFTNMKDTMPRIAAVGAKGFAKVWDSMFNLLGGGPGVGREASVSESGSASFMGGNVPFGAVGAAGGGGVIPAISSPQGVIPGEIIGSHATGLGMTATGGPPGYVGTGPTIASPGMVAGAGLASGTSFGGGGFALNPAALFMAPVAIGGFTAGKVGAGVGLGGIVAGAGMGALAGSGLLGGTVAATAIPGVLGTGMAGGATSLGAGVAGAAGITAPTSGMALGALGGGAAGAAGALGAIIGYQAAKLSKKDDAAAAGIGAGVGLGAGAGMGAAVGMMFGGPMGAAVGALIGGIIGGAGGGAMGGMIHFPTTGTVVKGQLSKMANEAGVPRPLALGRGMEGHAWKTKYAELFPDMEALEAMRETGWVPEDWGENVVLGPMSPKSSQKNREQQARLASQIRPGGQFIYGTDKQGRRTDQVVGYEGGKYDPEVAAMRTREFLGFAAVFGDNSQEVLNMAQALGNGFEAMGISADEARRQLRKMADEAGLTLETGLDDLSKKLTEGTITLDQFKSASAGLVETFEEDLPIAMRGGFVDQIIERNVKQRENWAEFVAPSAAFTEEEKAGWSDKERRKWEKKDEKAKAEYDKTIEKGKDKYFDKAAADKEKEYFQTLFGGLESGLTQAFRGGIAAGMRGMMEEALDGAKLNPELIEQKMKDGIGRGVRSAVGGAIEEALFHTIEESPAWEELNKQIASAFDPEGAFDKEKFGKALTDVVDITMENADEYVTMMQTTIDLTDELVDRVDNLAQSWDVVKGAWNAAFQAMHLESERVRKQREYDKQEEERQENIRVANVEARILGLSSEIELAKYLGDETKVASLEMERWSAVMEKNKKDLEEVVTPEMAWMEAAQEGMANAVVQGIIDGVTKGALVKTAIEPILNFISTAFSPDMTADEYQAKMDTLKTMIETGVVPALEFAKTMSVDILEMLIPVLKPLGFELGPPETRPVTPGAAEGGLIMEPTLTQLGERGPEMVIPFEKLSGGAMFGQMLRTMQAWQVMQRASALGGMLEPLGMNSGALKKLGMDNSCGQQIYVNVTGNYILNDHMARDLADTVGESILRRIKLHSPMGW